MNLPDDLLPEGWYWLAWLLWVPVLLRSLWLADWRLLKDQSKLNLWFGMMVLLMLIWSMKAGVKPGLSLHLLGSMVVTLCFGPHLALLALSLVLLVVTLNADGGMFAFALNALLLTVSTVFLSDRIYHLILDRLPRHFFVYIFVNGFFGAALVTVSLGVLLSAFLAMASDYTWDYLSEEYLPYFLLLAFSEAWLSGMVITLFVIYRPEWVVTFDDNRYLRGK